MATDEMKAAEAMRELIRLDHRRMLLVSSLFEKHMSRMDFGVLDCVYTHRAEHPDALGIYASEIAEKCHVTRSAISRQLQLLETRGWITRTVDPHSKRSVFVSLTDKGTEILLEHYEASKHFHDRVYYRMGEQRMETLLESMRQLTTAMEQEVQRFKQEEAERGGNK